MKKSILRFMVCTAVVSATMFTSCEKDDHEEEHEEELITTMKLTFTPIGSGTPKEFQYRDADGAGGANPTQDDIVLNANTAYNVSIKLLDESKSPAEDITKEIEEEADAHRFYFESSSSSGITVSGLNVDASSLPLGVNSSWATTGATTGKIKVTLRHYGGNPPGKALADLVTSIKSSTDISVEFNTKIQ